MEKRERILDAARKLFLRNGLRATTMEAIAREAGIAKPTLYAQFTDKQAIFRALLTQLVRDKHGAFERALEAPGPASTRIGAALVAMFGTITEALAGSVHAEELFAAHHEGAALFAQSNAQIVGRLAEILGTAGVAEPQHLARLLLAAAKGLADEGIGAPGLAADIMLLTQRLVEPAIVAAPTPARC